MNAPGETEGNRPDVGVGSMGFEVGWKEPVKDGGEVLGEGGLDVVVVGEAKEYPIANRSNKNGMKKTRRRSKRYI